MDIVDELTHRVLAYVDALNRQDVHPPSVYVDEFGDTPDPRESWRGGITASLNAISAIQKIHGTRKVEDYSAYLVRLGWASLDDNHGVVLTRVGRGLLRALNTPTVDSANSVVEVVLGPDNPFSYAQALNSLISVDDALLVEPYFRIDQLQDVAELPNITRVLLGPRVKPAERKVLAVGLTAFDPEHRLELRVAEDLHDRYLIPSEDGAVLMLGASLGGIGKKVSTITTIGPEASMALRTVHEQIWDQAAPIAPQGVAGEEDTPVA